jgi:hypothetical protein
VKLIRPAAEGGLEIINSGKLEALAQDAAIASKSFWRCCRNTSA